MNFQTCSYYVTVYETGTITGAAEKLYISQQALSKTIARLEKELEVVLFERSMPIVPTRAGEIVYRRAKQILSEYEGLHADLEDLKTQKQSRINVGLTMHAVPFVLSDVIAQFSQLYPEVQMNLVVLTPEQKKNPGRDIDCIIGTTETIGQMQKEICYMDRLCIVLRKDLYSRYYPNGEQVRQNFLADGDYTRIEKIPLLSPNEVEIEGKKDGIIRAAYLGKTLEDQKAIRVEDDMIMSFCRNGVGYTIMPEDAARRVFGGDDRLDIVILQPKRSWPVNLWYHDKTQENKVLTAFLKILREEFAGG